MLSINYPLAAFINMNITFQEYANNIVSFLECNNFKTDVNFNELHFMYFPRYKFYRDQLFLCKILFHNF